MHLRTAYNKHNFTDIETCEVFDGFGVVKLLHRCRQTTLLTVPDILSFFYEKYGKAKMYYMLLGWYVNTHDEGWCPHMSKLKPSKYTKMMTNVDLLPKTRLAIHCAVTYG